MPNRYRRPTVGVTVRLGVETRELLDQVAKARRLSLAATIEQLVIEESNRLGPPKKKRDRQ
jgi:hypothetical protein